MTRCHSRLPGREVAFPPENLCDGRVVPARPWLLGRYLALVQVLGDPSCRGQFVVVEVVDNADPSLFQHVRFQLRGVSRIAIEPVGDRSQDLPFGALVVDGRAGPLDDGFSLPLGNYGEDIKDQSPPGRARVDLVGHQKKVVVGCLGKVVTEQGREVSHRSGQSVEFGDHDSLGVAVAQHPKSGLQTGSIEALGGQAGIALYGHKVESVEITIRFELGDLGFEGDAFRGLLVRRNSDIADDVHALIHRVGSGFEVD